MYVIARPHSRSKSIMRRGRASFPSPARPACSASPHDIPANRVVGLPCGSLCRIGTKDEQCGASQCGTGRTHQLSNQDDDLSTRARNGRWVIAPHGERRLSGARIGGIRPVMRSLDASAAKSAYHPARLAERLRAVADPGQRGRRGCESSVRASDAAVRSLQDDCGPRGVSRRVEKDAKKLCISGRRSGRPTHRAGLRQLVTMWERGPGAGGGPSRAGERA